MLPEPHSSHAGDAQRELGDDEGAMFLGIMLNVSKAVVCFKRERRSESVYAFVKLSSKRSLERAQ